MKMYSHKPRDDSGKAHPDKVAQGLPMVDKEGGSHPGVPDFNGPAKSSAPKSARGGDGTATLRGTTVKHLHKPKGGPRTSARDNRPSNVKVSDGISVPRKIRNP